MSRFMSVQMVFLMGTVAACAADLNVQQVRIADGIYQFLAPYDGDVACSAAAIVNDTDVLVFDTTTRPSTARAILAQIRKITEKPVRYVVNSHSHPDHWSGNEVFADAFPGVQIISTDDARQIMKAVAPVWPPSFSGNLKRAAASLDAQIKSGKNADGSTFTDRDRHEAEADLALYGDFVEENGKVRRTYPNLTFHDRLTLYSGSREFRFTNYFGDATGEAVLYLPNEKVLLTGDVLVYPRPYFPNGYRIAPFLESLKAISRLDVDVIIPGHGPALHDKTYLYLAIELLENVTAQVRTMLEHGAVTVEEVQKGVSLGALLPKFAALDKEPGFEKRFPRAIDGLVKRIYDEARDGREFTR